MKSKKYIKLIAIAVLAAITITIFAGCGGTAAQKSLKVGVCAGPYGDMFKEAIQPSLEKLGYSVELVEFSDYVQPNNSLADKEIDLNVFQHSTYLKKFAAEHTLDLTYISEIPTAAMGVFSNKYKDLDDIADGGTVAIPNDDTNLSRAIRVLAQTGVVQIDPNIDAATATPADIVSNPKNLTFTEVNAEILPSVLDSTDIAVINGNYALSAGLKLTDAVYNEKLGDGYFNVIAVRSEDETSQFAKDIKAIVHSDDFRSVIEDKNNQYVAFGKPAGYKD